MSETDTFVVEAFDPTAGISPSDIASTHLSIRRWQVEVGQNTFSDIEESQRDLRALEEYYVGSGGNFFVAAGDNGELLGFVGLRGDGEGRGMIKRLAVLPEHHRKGIGAALVSATVQWAKANGFTWLELHTNRGENARPVYESVGFEVTGYLPEHDDWVMELYLR